ERLPTTVSAKQQVRLSTPVSQHFSKFPYHIGVVYNAPLQCGASNLLWPKPTGYKATMVGLPYDDLASWRSIYPSTVFAGLLREMGNAFAAIADRLADEGGALKLDKRTRTAVHRECNIIETISIHYRSIANQVDFIELRDALA